MKNERKPDLSRMKKTTRLIIMLIALGVALTSCAHQKADASLTETTSSVISRASSSDFPITGGTEITKDSDLSTSVVDTILDPDDSLKKPYDSDNASPTPFPSDSDEHFSFNDPSTEVVETEPDTSSSAATQNLTSTYTVNAKLWFGVFPKTLLFDKGSSIDTEEESSFYFLKDPQNVDWGYIRINIAEESETEYRTSLKCYVSLQDYTAGNLPVTTIGGSAFSSGCSVTLVDGTVTAIGKSGGAGVGGGEYGNGGNVYVSGGTLIVRGYQAIGKGYSGEIDGGLMLGGIRVYDSETSETPVAYAKRYDTCRSGWAKLTLCDPHGYDLSPFCPYCGGIVSGMEQFVCGDANDDGIITAADAAIILRALVGMSELCDHGRLNADVDGDGAITAADAAMILRFVVGLIQTFPVQQP